MSIKSALCIKLFKNIFRSYTFPNDITANVSLIDTGQDVLTLDEFAYIPSSNSSVTNLPVQMNLENKRSEVDEEETIPEEKEKDDDKIEASLTPNSDIFNENLSVDIQIEMLPAVHFPSEAKLPRDAINNTAPFPMVNQMDKFKDLTFEQKEQPFFKSPEKSEVNDDQQQTNTEENLNDDHCFSIQLSIDAPAQLALDSPSHPKKKPNPYPQDPNQMLTQ